MADPNGTGRLVDRKRLSDVSDEVRTRKRPRKGGKRDAYRAAYERVSRFDPIRPTQDAPGTPPRFFGASYRVSVCDTSSDLGTSQGPSSLTAAEAVPPCSQHQIVHKHANGLVVVTAPVEPRGDETERLTLSEDDPTAITSIEFAVGTPCAQMSAGEKRKLLSKMLRGKKVDEAIRPGDTLATAQVTTSKQSTNNEENVTPRAVSVELKCPVFGLVLEVNERLLERPQLLQDDPLLDGYLAVILPAGPFPPNDENQNSKESEETIREGTKEKATGQTED